MNAKLVFITGSRAGTSALLEAAENTIGRKAGQSIMFPRDEILVSAEHATIVLRGDRYYVRDLGSRNGTFVNQERVTERMLEPGDVIEFGVGGPSAQFVIDTEVTMTPTLDLGDDKAPAALRRLSKSRAKPAGLVTGELLRRFPSTRDFVALVQKNRRRATVNTIGLVALVAVAGAVVVWQSRNQSGLQDRLALFASELDAERGTRKALQRNLSDIQTRYDSLLKAVEQSAAASNQTVRDAAARFSRGVGLIVYSYGFARPGTTELLRYQVDPQNRPRTRISRIGQIVPVFGFGGSGPPVQRQGSATGFLVDSAGWVLTNRHVAEPWREDVALDALREDGVDAVPRFIVLQIYFPPGGPPHPLRVHATSTEADVAVMSTVGSGVHGPVLPMEPNDLAIPPGAPIAFIGYPTGVHNLLFRVERDERSEILERVGEQPVDLARELARQNRIQPLVTSGSISDTTRTELIHTAEATGGGSGGPLIGSGGLVVGIHYAAVRSPIQGDPFQTQRGVRIAFAWDVLPPEIRDKLRAAGR